MKQKATCIGVWLDHSKAHFIETDKEPAIIETVLSTHVARERVDGEEATGAHFGKNMASNNEYQKHNREQNDQTYYFKVLGDRIKHYDKAVLFGPTTAKNELFNYLTSDKQFAGVRVHFEPGDKMTENQMTSFVKNYFAENNS